MKQFAFILGIVLLAASLVAVGVLFGYGERFRTDMFSTTELDKTIVDASTKAMVLRDLDSGQINDARWLLRTELDSDIVTIWSLGDYSDARNRKMITNLLAKIAIYRAEYPANYTNPTTGDWAEIDSKITSILQQAKEQDTKK